MLWGAATAVAASATPIVGTAEAAARSDVAPEDSNEVIGTVVASRPDSLRIDLGDGKRSVEVVPAQSAEVVDARGGPRTLESFAVGDAVSVSLEPGTAPGDGTLRPIRVSPAVLGRRSDVER
ncbi:MAG: hypothetical protein ACJ768_06405 [Gaiellaceae bacterium]